MSEMPTVPDARPTVPAARPAGPDACSVVPDAAPTFPRLRGQLGLATVAQVLSAGWTRSALRHARATRWQEPMPRVLAPHRGPLGAEVLLVAAGLWAGPTAVLTGGLALRRLGLQVARVDRTTVLVPLSARARTHGRVRTLRTGRPPAVGATLGVVRVAGAARALADAAVHESHAPADLQHLAISVLHRGLATPDALERELWGRSQARVGPVWRGLEAYVGGAWSRPEGVLREVVDCDGSLPPMVTNCGLVRSSDGLYLGTPDGYIEAAGVAVQVHSRTYHQGIDDQGGDRWGRTVEKDTPLVAAGVRVVGVTPWTLYSRPARFLRQLHQVVELGLAGPRPAVRVVAPRTR